MLIQLDRREAGRGRIDKTASVVFSMDVVDVGADIGRLVAKDYGAAELRRC